MRVSRGLVVAGVVGAMLGIGGCSGNSTTTAGKLFVDLCADDELKSNAVLYFGPSNQIGPGSVWARLGANGGYQPQWRTADLNLNYPKVVQSGQPFPCNLSMHSSFTASGGLSVLSPAANVSAEVKADFARAKTIAVSAREAAWDMIVAGPYLIQLKGISDPAIKSDVFGKNRLVVRRALRLSGYRALLDFGSNLTPEIKAKYDGGKLGPKEIGDVGAQFNVQWTNEEKLELTTMDNVYVAGEFAELINGEFASTKGDSPTLEALGDKWIKPYVAPK